jgi:predicted dehydrogenase
MKQVVQNYKTGELWLEDVPTPICPAGGVLVRAANSLVSIGTEKMKVTQARMNLLQMARTRPDKVKQVLTSVKQVGVMETIAKVRERLDSLTPLGYSLAGVVEEVGSGIDDFQVGDRVACAGEKIACHAEFVAAPHNLCVRVPDNVDFKDAAFSTVGAIAMQGVRQAEVSLGDSVAVIGLGLVGLLGVQLLKAAGCRVIGIDLDPQKVELAKLCGADIAITRTAAGIEEDIAHTTDGLGVDAAYIAASADTSDPMELAGHLVRDRGKVVIVGMVRVEADWQLYYEKELSVVMSRSYGPGRYDPTYEFKGIDYPIGYVPWTLRRNLAEFLRLIGAGLVKPSVIGPELYPFSEAPAAYDKLGGKSGSPPIAILFDYPSDAQRRLTVNVPARSKSTPHTGQAINVSLIGAGNFATGTLIPALKRSGLAQLHTICSARGLSAASAGRRHEFEHASSDYQAVLSSNETQAVVIATRHDTHARFAADALRAGKHVYVEKPLAMSSEQLDDVLAAQRDSDCILVPGFNRRFSPLSIEIRRFFAERNSPIEIMCRVNAGALGDRSWYKDSDEGGWRIVSEGCHFVDLIQFIANARTVAVSGSMIEGTGEGLQNDNCILTLQLSDGSIAMLMYVANGDPSYEKERIEVFGQGRTAVIDNWRQAKLISSGKTKRISPAGSGKGHGHAIKAFLEAIRAGAPSPISLEDAASVTLTTLAAAEALANKRTVEVPNVIASTES